MSPSIGALNLTGRGNDAGFDNADQGSSDARIRELNSGPTCGQTINNNGYRTQEHSDPVAPFDAQPLPHYFIIFKRTL